MPLPVSIPFVAAAVLINRPSPYRPPVHPEPKQQPLRSLGGAAAVMQAPEKMEIHVLDSDMDVDLDDTARWMQAQFNPGEVNEAVRANWPKLTVQGHSHERMHYQNTASVPFRVELYFDAYDYQDLQSGAGYIETARDFLRSLCYPTVVTGAPPRCLFWWPKFISLTAVLESCDFRYTQFARDGIPLKFTATLSLMEIRDVRLTRSDAFNQGNRRSAPPVGRK